MLKTPLRRRAAGALLAGLLPVCAMVATGPLGLVPSLSPIAAARAQSPDADQAFVRSLGDRLVAVVNGPAASADKKAQILALVDHDVDVDAIGRFCLSRYWRLATPDQQARYLHLFHQVLSNTITGKLGEYRGVAIQVGQTTVQDGKSHVATVINRPGQAPANVQWVVSDEGGGPRIVDVVAEGVSLSLTQRSDYESYLQRNGNQIDKLLGALQAQVSRNG